MQKLRQKYESGSNVQVKRQRMHNFENIDKHLMRWFQMARDKKLVLPSEMLLQSSKDSKKLIGTGLILERKEVTCKKLHGKADL